MWHFISDQISTKINHTFICETAKMVHEQHQHTCYVLKGTNKRYFVKLRQSSQASPDKSVSPTPLKSEAESLTAIEASESVTTPQVICYGLFEENHKFIEYLVLQYISFKSPTRLLWEMAGSQLAQMHQYPTENLAKFNNSYFGWHQPNWVGSTIQNNVKTKSWATFYCQHRLEPLLAELTSKGVNLKITDVVLDQIHQYLSNHTPKPSLLHGDLWRGNLGFTRCLPIIFDPAVYIGDREIDLAMAKLFGGFAQRFFDVYEQMFPLKEGAKLRLLLYQLYPIMNHALMFGGDYLHQTNYLVDKIQQQMV